MDEEMQNQELTKESIVKNKNEAITKITEFLDKLMLDEVYLKKANLLSYWLKSYITYLNEEDNFDSNNLKEYCRGDIIKANLGFNIGNEEGGLHYCVVLDKKNAQSHSTLTVVPLTSLKPHKKPRKTSVFIGNEIYENLSQKNNEIMAMVKQRIENCKKELKKLFTLSEATEEKTIFKKYKLKELENILKDNDKKLLLCSKIDFELNQMKNGSIALINQITTISKQRIYNPKNNFDTLSGIKLSPEKMQLIDEKIKKLYIN